METDKFESKKKKHKVLPTNEIKRNGLLMSSRQLTQIKTDRLAKDLISQLLLKIQILSNIDIIATIEDAAKDFEKEETHSVSAKIRAKNQNFKPHKSNHSKNEDKTLKEVPSDMSVVSLPADRGASTVIFNRE